MDAEKNSCDEMQEFLQRKGFFVLSAHSASEGMLILQMKQIDILILDIRLPDANGLELLKDYKSRYPIMDVIVISGHGDMDSVIEAMHLGVLDFLRKPLRQMDLLKAIERSQKTQIKGFAMLLPDEKKPVPARPLPN